MMEFLVIATVVGALIYMFLRWQYARKFGKKSAAETVKGDVLALTYTANDMEPFARDMGYAGKPLNGTKLTCQPPRAT
jgi:hypothetical protein